MAQRSESHAEQPISPANAEHPAPAANDALGN